MPARDHSADHPLTDQVVGVGIPSNPNDYHPLANDAALLEREGFFAQAKAYWLAAAEVANTQNRQWANHRAHACEMREVRRAA